jgi:anti-sigma factor RsiW
VTCRELNDFLADYVDGELAPSVRSDFEKHLALCPTCLVYVDSYRDTIRLGKAAFDDLEGPPPADVPERLVSAVLAARRRRKD